MSTLPNKNIYNQPKNNISNNNMNNMNNDTLFFIFFICLTILFKMKEILNTINNDVKYIKSKNGFINYISCSCQKQCSICISNIIDKNNTTITQCGHKYHTSCIGAWWCAPRDRHNPEGTCPLCRAPTFKGTTAWRWNSRKGRVALLKRLAKKGQVPKPILRVVQKFNKASYNKFLLEIIIIKHIKNEIRERKNF